MQSDTYRRISRDVILEGTSALLAAEPSGLPSMDALAAYLGTSKPTLYAYFASKDELIGAVAVHELDLLLAIITCRPAGRTALCHLTLSLQFMLWRQIAGGTIIGRLWEPELLKALRAHPLGMTRLRQADTALLALVRAGIAEGDIAASLDATTIVWTFYTLIGALAPCSSSLAAAEQLDNAAIVIRIFEQGVRSTQVSHERALGGGM